ncbi:MAG: hypothetical protein RR873_04430, partial [Christensenella sp.]
VMMTVIGIAGCTALMLTGFGLQYSIGVIVNKQFDEIFVYDAMGSLDDEATSEDIAKIDKMIAQTEGVKDSMMIGYQGMDAISGDNKMDMSPFVPQHAE